MEQEMLNRLWELLGHAEQVFPSRRERIATAALPGVIAKMERGDTPMAAAIVSVGLADALIAELDKPAEGAGV